MATGINCVGAAYVTTELLRKSKAGKEGDESFESKMARDNFFSRAYCVRDALNSSGGPTLLAAQRIIGTRWFTDVEPETLAEWLKEIVGNMPENAENGDLEFPEPVADNGGESPASDGYELEFHDAEEWSEWGDEDDDDE